MRLYRLLKTLQRRRSQALIVTYALTMAFKWLVKWFGKGRDTVIHAEFDKCKETDSILSLQPSLKTHPLWGIHIY